MQDRLRNYMDSLFEDAPKTKRVVELKEEILQNLIDKYNDLLMEGKSEEAAYNIAVASVGDVSGLLQDLKAVESPVMRQASEEELDRGRKRNALFISIAVALYILCVIPVMLLEDVGGIILMFVMAAVATALLIYNSMTKVKYNKTDDTVVEEFREWKADNKAHRQAYNAVSSAVWTLTVALYFIISFTTMAWHITWIIFLIAAAVTSIIKAIFDLRK